MNTSNGYFACVKLASHELDMHELALLASKIAAPDYSRVIALPCGHDYIEGNKLELIIRSHEVINETSN